MRPPSTAVLPLRTVRCCLTRRLLHHHQSGDDSSGAGPGTPRRAELKGPSAADHERDEVAKVIPQERVSELLREHTAHEPVPQIMQETDDVMLDGSEVVQVFAQELAQNRAAEQIVAAFEPQSQQKLAEVIQVFLQERVSDHIGEHFVDVPGPTDSGMNRRS